MPMSVDGASNFGYFSSINFGMRNPIIYEACNPPSSR